MSKLRILELFGGIGACSKALERLGIDYEIADYVEIDKYAVASFNAMHGTNFEPQDICEWNKDIETDLIMHGSPCQDFSLAGLQAGGDEGSGTRSSLMYETIRIVEKLKPKPVDNFILIKNATKKGYLEAEEGDGVDISSRMEYHRGNVQKGMIQTLDTQCDRGVVVKPKVLGGIGEKDSNNGKQWKQQNRIYDDNVAISVCTAFNPYYQIKLNTKNTRIKKLVENTEFGNDEKYLDIYNQKSIKNISGTLKSGMDHQQGNIIYDTLRIRKLTPKECWRLMGFDDEDFDKASKVNSNTQLYKQAGNSIVVNVIESILKELL